MFNLVLIPIRKLINYKILTEYAYCFKWSKFPILYYYSRILEQNKFGYYGQKIDYKSYYMLHATASTTGWVMQQAHALKCKILLWCRGTFL